MRRLADRIGVPAAGIDYRVDPACSTEFSVGGTIWDIATTDHDWPPPQC